MDRVRTGKVAALLGFLLIAGFAAATETTDEISLRWALGARVADDASPSAIRKDTQLGGGARLKFLVEPLSAASVYLILLDSSDAIHVLYRESGLATDNQPSYIPAGRHWFELDDQAGLETFFLLASAEPLRDLEGLLDRHEAAEAPARKEISAQVVTEIRRLHKAHRQFARPVEKPVMIGGRTRGEGADGDSAIDQLAVEITAERFYGKTITIDH